MDRRGGRVSVAAECRPDKHTSVTGTPQSCFSKAEGTGAGVLMKEMSLAMNLSLVAMAAAVKDISQPFG